MTELNPHASPVADLGSSARVGTLSGICNEALQLFTKYWVLIVLLEFGIYGPFELLGTYLEHFVLEPDDFLRAFQYHQLVETVVGTLVTACVIGLAAIVDRGDKPWLGNVLVIGIRSWPRLVLTRIIVNIALVLALLLLIWPGIYFGVRVCLAEPIVVAERLTGRRAIQRSFQLSKGRFWLLLVLNVIVVGSILVVAVATSFVAEAVPGMNHWIIQALLSTLIGLPAAFATLAYYAAYRQFIEIAESASQEDTPLASAPLATSPSDASKSSGSNTSAFIQRVF